MHQHQHLHRAIGGLSVDMSAHTPSRRLGQSALAALHRRPTCWAPARLAPLASRRSLSLKPKAGSKSDDDLANPLLERYLKEKDASVSAKGTPVRPSIREGTLSQHPTSLFLPERELPGYRPNMSPRELNALRAQVQERKAAAQKQIDRKLTSMNLDPDPEARRKLERRLVIRSLQKHGRMTKAAKLLRTERQSLYKSHFLPTSVKKLTKIMNQIAGKTVSEALVQLRFSKKKAARDVHKGLLIAQDEAIAARGMGLEDKKQALERWTKQRNDQDLGIVPVPTGKKLREMEAKNKVIELKDGTKKVVRDPTEIYVDQAWVGRGSSWKSPEFRARGQVNLLTHRTTSFSILLKEEKTRIRLSNEIKKKRDNRKLWTALPDRPITTQRQYCLW